LPKVFHYEKGEKAAFEEAECLDCGNRFSPSESAFDIDGLRFEYERLSRRVSTRESSTLTIAAFMTAGASVFFALLLRTSDWRMYLAGTGLILVVIVYRELTVFTIDRVENERIHELESDRRLFPREVPRIGRISRFFRSFVFRLALLFFPVFFLRLMTYGGDVLFALSLVIWLLYALIPSLAGG
jgi:hypothetical protein